MADESAATGETTPIDRGVVVYDHAGDELGVITELTSEGFEVSTRVEIEQVDDEGRVDIDDLELGSQSSDAVEDDLKSSEQEQDPGQEFGEGYIMWRCDNCGEMGELEDGLPAECPNCGDENVYKRRED